jgi:hypothetical protein
MLLLLIVIVFLLIVAYMLYMSWPHRASGESCNRCGAPKNHCKCHKPCPMCGGPSGQCGCPKAPPREAGCPFC